MAVHVVTPPEGYPLTLAEIKQHLRVDFDDDDSVIEVLLAGATAYAEKITGRALVERTLDVFFDSFPSGSDWIVLPQPPLVEVEGLFYRDGGVGDEVEIATAEYVVDLRSEKARIGLPSSGSWPSISSGLSAVRVRLRAGYVSEDSPAENVIDEAIINAIVLRVKADYDQDADAEKLRAAAENLLMSKRIETGIA